MAITFACTLLLVLYSAQQKHKSARVAWEPVSALAVVHRYLYRIGAYPTTDKLVVSSGLYGYTCIPSARALTPQRQRAGVFLWNFSCSKKGASSGNDRRDKREA